MLQQVNLYDDEYDDSLDSHPIRIGDGDYDESNIKETLGEAEEERSSGNQHGQSVGDGQKGGRGGGRGGSRGRGGRGKQQHGNRRQLSLKKRGMMQ